MSNIKFYGDLYSSLFITFMCLFILTHTDTSELFIDAYVFSEMFLLLALLQPSVDATALKISPAC